MGYTIYEDTSNEQIKGQLSFIEEQEQRIETPKTYATPCGGCICNVCANDVNGKGKPEEMIEPCFNCDDCREYDGNKNKKCNKKTSCDSFVMTEYHAEQRRRKIKLIR